MDSTTVLNPDLPHETRVTIEAALLESDAQGLEVLASKKELSAALPHRSSEGRDAMLADAAVFRSDAAMKRAKAARLRATP